MTEPLLPLDEELEALLSPDRPVPNVSMDRQARALDAVRHRIAASPAVIPTPMPPPVPLGPAPTILRHWWFGIGGLVVGLAIGAGATALLLPNTEPPQSEASAGESSPAPNAVSGPRDTRPHRVTEAPNAVAPQATPAPLSPIAENARATPTPAPTASPRARRDTANAESAERSGSAGSSAADGLLTERRMVDAALAQLRRGRPADALHSVARHEAQYEHGQLVEAREIVKIRALMALNRRDEAHAAFDRFRARFGSSSSLPSLARLLGEHSAR